MAINRFQSGVNTSFSTELNENSSSFLRTSGLNLIRQLQDRTVALSSDGGEFSEAYTDATGRLNSVSTSDTLAEFDTDKYKTYNFPTEPYVLIEATSLTTSVFQSNSCSITQIDTGKWILTASGATDGEKEARMANTLFVRTVAGTSGTASTAGAVIDAGTVGLTALKTNITNWVGKRAVYVYGGNPSDGNTSNYTGTFAATSGNDGVASWSNCDGTTGGSNEFNVDTSADEINNPSDCRASAEESGTLHSSEWRIPSGVQKNIGSGTGGNWYSEVLILTAQTISWVETGAGSFSDRDFTTDDSVPLFAASSDSDLPESIVEHTIPSGTFSSTLDSAFMTALVEDWEDGANIQFKLTNTTEDSGYFDYNTVATFTAFTSEPTTLIVKLVPKTTSPTSGYPSINGVTVYGD